MEYEGLAKDRIPYYTSFYNYMWLYFYYLKKICVEAVSKLLEDEGNPHLPATSSLVSSQRSEVRVSSHNIAYRYSSSEGPDEMRRRSSQNTKNIYSYETVMTPSRRAVEDEGVVQAKNLFGDIDVNIIRISDLQVAHRLYFAKLRIYIRIRFNNQSYTSKMILTREIGQGNVEVAFHDHAIFHVVKLEDTLIKFEVYDHYGGIFPDKLVGTYQGHIKEWIANGRFEDSLDILNLDGKKAGKLQINARMKFNPYDGNETLHLREPYQASFISSS